MSLMRGLTLFGRKLKDITVSYWSSLPDIEGWKQNDKHKRAQELGRKEWYECYMVRVCKVEREYSFNSIIKM